MRIVLERFRTEDAEYLCYLRNLPELRQWFRQNHAISLHEELKFILDTPKDKFYGLMILNDIEGGDLEPVGFCSLSNVDHVHKSAEFGIAVDPAYQKKGFASLAMKGLLILAFREFSLNRVYSDVIAENPALDFYCRKFGFVREGRNRKAYFKNGHYVDSTTISLLKEDFDAISRGW